MTNYRHFITLSKINGYTVSHIECVLSEMMGVGHVRARPRGAGWQLALAAIESRSAVLIVVIVGLLGYLSAFFWPCHAHN